MSEENKSKLPESIKLDNSGNLIDVVVNSGTTEEKTIKLPAESLTTQEPKCVIVESKSTWTKKQRLFLDSMAILGLVNMIIFFVTQTSFVQQNIYWVYGLFTFADVIAFLLGLSVIDTRNQNHFKKTLPSRFKTYMWLTGLWILSIPVVVVGYFFGMTDWFQVGYYAWGATLVASGLYDAAYVMVIGAVYVMKGMSD